MPIRPVLPVRSDSIWASRLTEPGWLLLPLRAFLGFTFSFAGLQKLANPAYLDPHSPTSVVGQMRLLQHSSPIGGLLGLSLHAPTAVGLLIAVGELAVGVGTLAGVYFRLAAVGGALLSLTFFLTVSWNTTPYYYGSDIVFVFAWITLLAFGSGDVLTVESWARNRARRSMNLRGGVVRPRDQAELDRRTVVWTIASAGLVGGIAALTGAITAAAGRALNNRGRSASNGLQPSPASTSPTSSPSAAPTGSSSANAATGTVIGPVTAVPLGQARSFNDPATGNPAYVVHLSANDFVAFSAVCTHAGCPVQWDQTNVQFVCPCHGGVYDGRTGQVLQGPPPAPLQKIPIQISAGQLRVDG